MNSLEYDYWIEQYGKQSFKKPEYDLWLDKYKNILDESKNLPVIDLGCGPGNDSLYLSERGYPVLSCDISEKALINVKEYVPNAKTMVVDMAKKLPFESSSVRVVISDLSLHYFRWEDTLKIVNEISRILMPGGCFLCRLNSTNDRNNGAGQGELLEDHYYLVYGNTKRFFDKKQIENLFRNFEIQHMEEYSLNRNQVPKYMWEIAAKTEKKAEA